MGWLARALLPLLPLGIVVGLLAWPLESAPGGQGNSWVAQAPDPEVYGKGWATAHWATSIDKMLVWGEHSHNYKGNNSLRAFDPSSNTWEALWPNTWGGKGCSATPEGGVQNRDNHVSFYVPGRGKKGEFWVLRGAYSSTFHRDCKGVKGKNYGGRFDLDRKAWVNVAHSKDDFAEGLIKDFAFNDFVGASAQGWCAAVDTGVVFGGGGSDLLQLIEPNPGGPEPYRFWKGVPPGSPPFRSQVQNNGACAGEYFYVYGGRISKTKEDRNDLWRLHVGTRRWTQMAPAPAARYKPVLTYDSRNHVLVLHGGSGTRDTWIYHIDANTWKDMTPSMRLAGDRPYRNGGRMGAYSPTNNQHIYTGGAASNEDGTRSPGAGGQTDAYTYSTGARQAAALAMPRPAGRPAAERPMARQLTNVSLHPGLIRLASTERAVPSSASPEPRGASAIEIPLNTWVARALPGRGKAPYSGKHMRLTYNPTDGRIYFLGGDYGGPGGPQSGRNEVYSYSVKDNDWRQEWPYCGPAGSVQPSHPDQVGWVYDTTRNIFWMLPGFQFRDGGRCAAAGSRLVFGEIITFDPTTRSWTVPGIPMETTYVGVRLYAQYDEKTDSIIRFYSHNGAAVATYDIKANSWMKKRFPSGNATLGKEYTALDPAKRVIYVIEPVQAKLYRYDIDKQDLRAIADTPTGSRYSWTMPVWDSVNRVLLFPQYFETSRIHLHAYHPDPNTWERDITVNNPGTHNVGGTNAVFDPVQNVLLVMGGRGNEKLAQGKIPNLYLYRYGNGSGRGATQGRGASR